MLGRGNVLIHRRSAALRRVLCGLAMYNQVVGRRIFFKQLVHRSQDIDGKSWGGSVSVIKVLVCFLSMMRNS